MQTLLADIGSAVGIARDFFEQAFELALANNLEVRAFRSLGCGFIKIYGNLKTLPDFAADFFGQGDTILDGHALDGNERNHVGCAHARVRAGVFG